MIPTWSFESPIALASPGLPLLLRTHLNPSTCALTMQSCRYRKTTKEAFLFLAQPTMWHCTGHLPLQRNKVPSKNYPETDRFLEFRTHLMKNTKNSRETGEGLDGNSVQPSRSPSPKWRASSLGVITIGHVHDGVILLLRPESFSFFLSYLYFVIPVRFE